MTFLRFEAERLLLDGCDDAATLRRALRDALDREEARDRLVELRSATSTVEQLAEEVARVRAHYTESEARRSRIVAALGLERVERERLRGELDRAHRRAEALDALEFFAAALDGYARGLAFRLAELEADRGLILTVCGDCAARSFASIDLGDDDDDTSGAPLPEVIDALERAAKEHGA